MGIDEGEIYISEDDIRKAIYRIFSEDIIVDTRLTILSIGRAICRLLGYSEKEFVGQPLSAITSIIFSSELLDRLKSGLFDEHPIEIRTADGFSVSVKVSGFYLGLISDVNDLIILKIRSTHELESVREKLSEKNRDMDEFIYATSHDLRGPLSTIKGLINLMKINKQVDEEHTFIVSQMSHFAEQLDSRLHKLIYFAEADKGHSPSTERMTLSNIVEKLRDHEDLPQSFPTFSLATNIVESSVPLNNAVLILALLQNIKAFLIRRGSRNFELIIKAAYHENLAEFELVANEIIVTEACRRKIEKANVGYTEILSDPEFTDLYSAKKIAFKIGAHLRFQIAGQSMRAHVTIPLESA